MADLARGSSWIATWTHAVVGPATKRAAAVWIGCGLVAAITFGGSGMRPHDLTHLALTDPPAGVALAAIWLLVFVPVARAIVRAPGAAYLRALPHGTLAPVAVGVSALIGLQLPWLALWLLGEGPTGAAVIALTTIAAGGLAMIAPPRRRPRWPGWRSSSAALGGVYLRAIARRAGDAIVRGIGLAALAGLTGGLIVRNNALAGVHAALVGTSVMLVILVPARAGMLAVVRDGRQQLRWVVDTLGVAPGAHAVATIRALVIVHVGAIAIALGGAAVVVRDGATVAVWAAISAAIAIVSAIAEAGVIARVAHRDGAALVIGSLGVAACGMLAVGVFGAIGIVGFAAVAVVLVTRE